MSDEKATGDRGWRYFGRTSGGPGVYEICRFPVEGGSFDQQDWTRYPEWLQPDGSWVHYPGDISLSGEMLSGYFDEEINEIRLDEVLEFYALWSSDRWPGRRRSV